MKTKPETQAVAISEDGVALRGNAGSVVILCADETIRAAIAYWASMLPAPVVVADDGYQASRVLRNSDCRLLVTDRVLPPWPGLDPFLQLRERTPSLRIAFVEGADREYVGLARVTGATDVLPRPLQRQAVVGVIRKALRTS